MNSRAVMVMVSSAKDRVSLRFEAVWRHLSAAQTSKTGLSARTWSEVERKVSFLFVHLLRALLTPRHSRLQDMGLDRSITSIFKGCFMVGRFGSDDFRPHFSFLVAQPQVGISLMMHVGSRCCDGHMAFLCFACLRSIS